MLGPGFRMACLIVVAISVIVVERAGERLRGESTRERAWFAAVRFTGIAVGLLSIVGLYWRELPHEVLGCAVFGAWTPALVLGAAQRALVRAEGRSIPHQVVNLATIALGVVGFWWLLPKLPGIVNLHWAGLGGDGYASPSKLWWVLGLLAFNTLAMEVAFQLLRDGPPRRSALLRFSEALLTSFNVAIVLVWLGVAADALAGIEATRTTLIAAALVVGLGVLLALSHAPHMLRHSGSEEPPI